MVITVEAGHHHSTLVAAGGIKFSCIVNRHLKRWQPDLVALLQQSRHHLVDSDGVGLHWPGGQGVPHGVQQVDNAPVGSEQKKPDLVGGN